jgi:hypothetical protein
LGDSGFGSGFRVEGLGPSRARDLREEEPGLAGSPRRLACFFVGGLTSGGVLFVWKVAEPARSTWGCAVPMLAALRRKSPMS